MKIVSHQYPFLFAFTMLILYACAPVSDSPASINPFDTNTPLPLAYESPAPIPSSIPKPTSAPKQEIECQPDFCIRTSNFSLARPILPPGNNRSEAQYPFGGTQGGARDVHHGIEFNNPIGTPVHAAADGVVIFASSDDSEIFGPFAGYYGNLVIIEHHLPGEVEPLFTLYGHLSEVSVVAGEHVQRGEMIGAVGKTGVAIGSHLHFEVREYRNDYASAVNPELYFAPLPEPSSGTPTGILVGRIESEQGEPLSVALAVQRITSDSSEGSIWYPELYGNGAKGSATFDENFMLAGLPEGHYRLAFIAYNRVFERFVQVLPGRITNLVITAKP